CPSQLADCGKGLGELGCEVCDALGTQFDCTLEEVGSARHVVSVESTAAGGCKEVRCTCGGCRRALVQEPERAAVGVGLFEVVAEDLLVLGDSRPRCALEPRCEPLVEVRAPFLRDRAIRRVLNEDVLEAEA